MAIQANIPLQIRQPEFESPFESYGKALHLKSMIDLGRERELRLEKIRQEDADRKAVREVFARNVSREGVLNEDKTLSELWSVSPTAASTYATNLLNRRRDAAALEKQNREAASARVTQFVQSLGGVQDAMGFRDRVMTGVAQGLLTPAEAVTYLRTPAWTQEQLRAIRYRGLTPEQQFQEEHRVEQSQRAAAAEARAVQDQLWQEAEERRKAEKFPEELAGLQAETGRRQAVLAGTLPRSPAQIEDDRRAAEAAERLEAYRQAQLGLSRERIGIQRTRAEQAATGEMTPAQRLADRKRIEAAEAKLDKEITEIGEQLKSGYRNGKSIDENNGAERQRLDALGVLKMDQVAELRRQKLERGYTTAEDIMPRGPGAPPPPAAAAPAPAPAPTGRIVIAPDGTRIRIKG